jgi:hypothetical protein
MTSPRLVIKSPSPRGKWKGFGLWLVYSSGPRSKTKAIKDGVSYDELSATISMIDDTKYIDTLSGRTAKVIPGWKAMRTTWVNRLLCNTEALEHYDIVQLWGEANTQWFKYVLYNKNTKKYILRSATSQTVADGPGTLLTRAQKQFGKCAYSHDDGWLVNVTNILTNLEFWKELEKELNNGWE